MTHEGAPRDADTEELSALAVVTALLRNRRRIAKWFVIGAVVGVGVAFLRGRTYTARGAFVPTATQDVGAANFRGLAGQIGVPVGASRGLSESPEFYAYLLTSPMVLVSVADTPIEPAANPAATRETVADRLGIEAAPAPERAELATERLRQVVGTSYNRNTGVVEFRVQTHEAALSAAIAEALTEAINEFNLRARQTQAGLERRFAERRLDSARQALRGAEDGLQRFLEQNRQIAGSPQLVLDRDRFQRGIALHQELVVRLSQALEDARLREVRDTPVITPLQVPVKPALPDSRRAAAIALIFATLAMIAAMLHQLWQQSVGAGVGNRALAVDALRRELDGVVDDLAGPIRRARGLGQRSGSEAGEFPSNPGERGR